MIFKFGWDGNRSTPHVVVSCSRIPFRQMSLDLFSPFVNSKYLATALLNPKIQLARLFCSGVGNTRRNEASKQSGQLRGSFGGG